LEGIAETDEDEEVFNSDHAQENRVINLAIDPTLVDRQKCSMRQHVQPISELVCNYVFRLSILSSWVASSF
uniref:Bestrophin homolog n=1 Tax=Echinostoma caproni TaxID=27848 RepID=A0A183BG70_9TREM